MSESTIAYTGINLQMIRYHACPAGTLGQLFLDGRHLCYTLEPALYDVAKSQHPAIVAGQYLIASHDSPRFGEKLPILQDVPGRKYILIHAGNAAKDTQGCILVGLSASRWPAPRLAESRRALALVNSVVLSALDKGQKVTIGISQQL